MCYPFCCLFPRLLFPLKSLFFSLVFTIFFCEEELLFICNIWGGCSDLNGRCLYILLDIEIDLLRDCKFKSREKVSCCVSWTSDLCYFKVELRHIIPCVPQKWCNRFLSGRIVWPICCPSERLLVSLLPTKCVQTQELPCRLPRILSSKSNFLVVRGRIFLIQTTGA